ncbi:hypothetical protein DFH07DRAFT_984037 [Mycena maculata]|uniref:Uncharacterized protein n=1 Tax=Mycena maculata TaxID=230809 RepID=A0AAD7IC33_9AGAR|nr:hypothetical protein DFH07DRAFT_984037 [Mycena maculata]
MGVWGSPRGDSRVRLGVRDWPRGLWRGGMGLGTRGWACGVGRAGMGAWGMHRREWRAGGEGRAGKEDKGGRVLPFILVHGGDLARARSPPCGYATNVPLLVKEMSAAGKKKGKKKLTSTPKEMGTRMRGWPRGLWHTGMAPWALACGVGRVVLALRCWPRGLGHAGMAPWGRPRGDGRTGFGSRGWPRGDLAHGHEDMVAQDTEEHMATILTGSP